MGLSSHANTLLPPASLDQHIRLLSNTSAASHNAFLQRNSSFNRSEVGSYSKRNESFPRPPSYNSMVVGSVGGKSMIGGVANYATLPRSASLGGMPTCLICLDNLTPEDFTSGEAISLDCECKGEVALRHKSCAIKWSQVKGNTICDVCKHPILNLPPVAPVERTYDADLDGDPLSMAEPPSATDYVFDCIRVTWVTMIICILFFEFSVAKSFLAGAIVGVVYTVFSKAMYSTHGRRLHPHVTEPALASTIILV